MILYVTYNQRNFYYKTKGNFQSYNKFKYIYPEKYYWKV